MRPDVLPAESERRLGAGERRRGILPDRRTSAMSLRLEDEQYLGIGAVGEREDRSVHQARGRIRVAVDRMRDRAKRVVLGIDVVEFARENRLARSLICRSRSASPAAGAGASGNSRNASPPFTGAHRSRPSGRGGNKSE